LPYAQRARLVTTSLSRSCCTTSRTGRHRCPSCGDFSVTQYSDEYTFADGQRAVLTFWHRPLHAMTDACTEAGFRFAVISEPPFLPDTPPELLPSGLGDRTAFICFIFFVLDAH
jgi:hypothetical protein